MAETCLVCEEKIAFYSPQAVVEVHGERVNIHFDCLSFFNRNPEKYGGVSSVTTAKVKSDREIQFQKRIENIKLTTAFVFTNHQIEDEVGIVTAECVFGMNIFRDLFADIRDIVGGRNKASQKVLRDARNTCLAELKAEAADLGAHGVIGIDLDYSEISGKGKGMLFLVASGTAVKFKKESV